MARRNLPWIILFNILGIALFLSWYLPTNHGFWFPIDSSIFFFFNEHLATNRTFLYLVAYTNNRAFDAIALLSMGLLYLSFFVKRDGYGKRRMLILGVVILFTAVILNQLGHLLPVQRASPTHFFENINRVGELTGINTKDSSRDSFPGDHGMMLIIFAVFMLRYFTVRSFIIALGIFVIFILPRIMIGAHWFSDIAVGSLSVVLVGLSWWLLTPASDALLNLLDKHLPGKYRP
ncbi:MULTISPECIES: phosphatase PAP2 family protein [Hafnia]|jgi:membrane-associated phospholipid phosphatase|uniref:Lipid A 1-diphosphate synthase n=1 Tax=Hafnia paralvei TaxID=546367 RepID=A0A2A2MHN8_9GAMM|nr:phosphatase PAP2 family protein [Hafnia paralvei]AMH19722.1 phosphatase PAP2 family protein [Hafnia paralvei]KHS42455.1 membrane protein [Hafnia paralvei]MBU2672083.1 phosphatase PAP2 family protein [Hafnia paralvei]MBW2958501.1 phosphatase PAP2 family protein [Hafnia paralvei]MCE9949042.1 phosphatase PAP2 family protein [Hafnia paralvei]